MVEDILEVQGPQEYISTSSLRVLYRFLQFRFSQDSEVSMFFFYMLPKRNEIKYIFLKIKLNSDVYCTVKSIEKDLFSEMIKENVISCKEVRKGHQLPPIIYPNPKSKLSFLSAAI